MTTITLEIPNKFKNILSNDTQLKKFSSYFVEDYLQELYEDMDTKNELENNSYDKELNNKLKIALWI